MVKTKALVLMLLVSIILFLAGCQQKGESGLGAGEKPIEQAPSAASLDIAYKQLGCKTAEECNSFCEANHDICGKFCSEYPDVCLEIKPERPAIPAEALTQCSNPTIIAKMKAVIDDALVNPPEKIRDLNWMTKILPSGNPYPGYYYDVSTAFGPAIDELMASGVKWSGEGEPPTIEGKYHYSFGFWDEVPKGKGAALGQETPETMDFSKYQLAIFYTTKKGSQDEMINSISSISMSESEAREYFYAIFKKSFINLDQKDLVSKGNKFYEAQWKDSEKTNDYWDVQIGEGYIAIGQGKVYSKESDLAGNVGTIWLYHSCKPCMGCDEWTKGTGLNRDCVNDADCRSGLACSGGYCIKREQGSGQGTQPAQGGTGGPGSPCSTAGDCGSGLVCKNSVCSIPMG